MRIALGGKLDNGVNGREFRQASTDVNTVYISSKVQTDSPIRSAFKVTFHCLDASLPDATKMLMLTDISFIYNLYLSNLRIPLMKFNFFSPFLRLPALWEYIFFGFLRPDINRLDASTNASAV
jgi:hypothetical protein